MERFRALWQFIQITFENLGKAVEQRPERPAVEFLVLRIANSIIAPFFISKKILLIISKSWLISSIVIFCPSWLKEEAILTLRFLLYLEKD